MGIGRPAFIARTASADERSPIHFAARAIRNGFILRSIQAAIDSALYAKKKSGSAFPALCTTTIFGRLAAVADGLVTFQVMSSTESPAIY